MSINRRLRKLLPFPISCLPVRYERFCPRRIDLLGEPDASHQPSGESLWFSSAAQEKQQEVCLMTVDLHPSFAANQSFADRKFIPHGSTLSSWEGVRRGGG